ncbi:hypothetical protein [Gallalistipes aquisgranensis]|uniref:hypothetical protein n=1 Tax=Gallalistipes aquisgranensis TaxID=2779358 RepID=UPI00293BA5BC|nr:hypothetical protein [Gallalistipes aquisgranensis]MBE5032404.1 hypothetical protein [Gallalistipes aquisgranensis]
MKSTKDFRGSREAFDSGDTIRKAVKLAPIKKSGKERHTLYGELDEEDDPDLTSYKKRESALDYFDDGEEEDDEPEDDEAWDEEEPEEELR